LYYTASGKITPVGGCPIHRLREDSSENSFLNLCTGSAPVVGKLKNFQVTQVSPE